MKKRLFSNKPKRLFTFGCSFTNYAWATWANILAYELNCEFYNFGKSGAGNQFISSMITQADQIYNFTDDDLVMVCWSSVSREDRYLAGRGFVSPGNLFSQKEYDMYFLQKYVTYENCILRDYNLIALTDKYLKNKTQYHMFSMIDLSNTYDEFGKQSFSKNNLHEIYSPVLSLLSTDFYTVLWNNSIIKKMTIDRENIHPHYCEIHPTIVEHYKYLTETFDYSFSKDTQSIVKNTYEDWKQEIKFMHTKTKKSTWLHNLVTMEEFTKIMAKYLVRESDHLSNLLTG